MNYEILETIKKWETDEPSKIRFHPPINKDERKLFVALVQSAYEMNKVHGLGGLAAVNSPASLSEKEAKKYISYYSEQSFFDKLFRRPDERLPRGIRADYIMGRAVKLNIYESTEVDGAYEMSTTSFIRDVGSIDLLFALTEEKLR